jgi:hypothetical protein
MKGIIMNVSKMVDNNNVLSKVDIENSKECKSCKIKQVYKATDGFVPVFCPADCKVQVANGYVPIEVMVDIIEIKPENKNLKVA